MPQFNNYFQLYNGNRFYWLGKHKYQQNTTNLWQTFYMSSQWTLMYSLGLLSFVVFKRTFLHFPIESYVKTMSYSGFNTTCNTFQIHGSSHFYLWKITNLSKVNDKPWSWHEYTLPPIKLTTLFVIDINCSVDVYTIQPWPWWHPCCILIGTKNMYLIYTGRSIQGPFVPCLV